MKYLIFYLSIVVASGLLLANVYTSIVDARAWGFDIPNSIEAARQYYKGANPGNFFRIFSPLNQLLALAVVIFFWKTDTTLRIYTIISFVLFVLGDVMTFAYFYPRNDIMFNTASLSDVALLRKTWEEWSFMNWFRSGVLVVGLVFGFLSVQKIVAAAAHRLSQP